ncbi:MAG: hypothetical protein LBF89_03860 [Bacteroidales bacterium]|nr:hypothetical protein [Bacteroidales bacterium]
MISYEQLVKSCPPDSSTRAKDDRRNLSSPENLSSGWWVALSALLYFA